ncbi:hypothetical protein BaRGS_00038333, partial [Batillaria attramentaria]
LNALLFVRHHTILIDKQRHLQKMSASESSESDEMTAEEQNQRNCENDDIARVLTNFMQSREETLEDLVGGFMYLTMVKQTVLLESKHQGASGNTGEDELEEETLESSDSTQLGSPALLRNRPASLTKFDNFVTTEDDSGDDAGNGGDGEKETSDDEWLSETPGYLASFDTTATGETTSDDTLASQPVTVGTTGLSALSGSSSQAAGTAPKQTSHAQTMPAEDKDFVEQEDPNTTSTIGCSSRAEVSGRVLNPGEADEEESARAPVVQTVSVLDFSTRTVIETSDASAQSCPGDVVE